MKKILISLLGLLSISVLFTKPASAQSPPVVTITNPSGSSVTAGTTVDIQSTITSGVGTSFYTVNINGNFLCLDTVAPYICQWTVPSSVGTSYFIQATGFDLYGASGSDTKMVTVIAPADTTPPSVNFSYPSNLSTVSRNTTITMTANASDNFAVASVKFYVNGVLKCTDTTATYSCTWLVPKPRNVVYTLRVEAVDTSGNISQKTITITSK